MDRDMKMLQDRLTSEDEIMQYPIHEGALGKNPTISEIVAANIAAREAALARKEKNEGV